VQNPSFPLTPRDATAALGAMHEHPTPMRRPLLIVGGYGDPGFATTALRRSLSACLRDGVVISVDLWSAGSFEDARALLVEAVDSACPTDDPFRTTEVDVVCHSAGGLAALYAADPTAGERTLRVARIFAIGTPFRGAAIADLPTLSPLVVDMRRRSPFLERLTDPERPWVCTVVPYTRSDDAFVGAANTAPPGQTPWWVPPEFVDSGHLNAFDDPRIVADIARRLRGEEPFTREPAAALPAR
jgi:hypothetical protein